MKIFINFDGQMGERGARWAPEAMKRQKQPKKGRPRITHLEPLKRLQSKDMGDLSFLGIDHVSGRKMLGKEAER